MAISREAYVQIFCSLVGDNVARVVDARDGWPGHIEVQVAGAVRHFSLHVGPIGPMSRGKSYEYRFQPPGPNRPMLTLPGTSPLLIGVWDIDQPAVFVAADPETRLGDPKRVSTLFPERLFRAAQEVGWAEPYINSDGGVRWAFLPQLLPSFIEHIEQGVPLVPKDVQIAIAGAGLIDHPDAAAAARARAATTRLIRDARFARSVLEAYGARCAMCGLNMGLVVGAHILPASVLGSSDVATNGLALCENHHRAFDRHQIWVDPDSRKLKIHPSMLESAETHEQDKVFVTTTFAQIAPPLQKIHVPARQAFVDRYAYFDGRYDWA